MNAVDPRRLRRRIVASIPENLFDVHVERRNIYIPESHLKALDPNRALVVGGRGTGKTLGGRRWRRTSGRISCLSSSIREGRGSGTR